MLKFLGWSASSAACALTLASAACVTSSSSPSAAPSFDGGKFDGAFDGAFDARVEPPPGDAQPDTSDASTTLTFVSGPDWPSFDGDLSGSDGGTSGPAKTVCVAPGVPASCPAGAVVYRATGAGWTGVVSVPGALWIWRGDVAVGNQADLQFAVFEKTFTLGANPSGVIQILADDYVEVRVNGTTAGSNGSVTVNADAFQAQSVPKTVDLTPYLHAGQNTLTVVGQNGPQSFGSCAAPCTFAENTAGVLFGGALTSH